LFDDILAISPDTLEKARCFVKEAGTGWDFNALHEQFSEQLTSGKFRPANANGAFIAFVKKKVQQAP